MQEHTPNRTNEQWLCDFRAFLSRRFPGRSTATHYSSDLTLFCSFLSNSLEFVQKADIDRFIDAQIAQGLAASTVKRRAACLRTFFQFLADELSLPDFSNPVKMGRHAPRQPKLLPRDLKDHQVHQLMSHIDSPRDYAIFSLMLYAGLRRSEITLLTFDAFDDFEPEPAPVKIRLQGKGQKERIVYLLRHAYAPILRYIEQKEESQRTGFLFRNHHNKPLTTAGIQFLVSKYSQRSGVSFTAHQLRHTCARWLAEGRMPVLSLSRFLGHSDLQTTQRYIDGADPQLRQEYEQAFQQAMNPSIAPLAQVHSSSAKDTNTTVEPTVTRDIPESFEVPDYLRSFPEWIQEDCLNWLNARWHRWKPTRRKDNASRLLRQVKGFLNWWLESSKATHWRELKDSDIREYVDLLQGRELAVSTIKTGLNRLYALLDFLREEGQIEEVPKRPSLEQPKTLPKHVSARELMRLEQVVEEERAKDDGDKVSVVLYYLMAHAGLRLCEVIDLKVEECEWERQKVRVREGKNRRDRVVYLTETGAEVLKAYLESETRAAGDLAISKGGKGVSGHGVWERIKKLGLKAGIDNLSPLRLRHTYATTLLNNGMTLVGLKKLMGHENMNTTLIYAHLADQTLEQQYHQAMQLIEKKDVTKK